MDYNIFTRKSKHLKENNIGYFNHMFNSLIYSKESFKASIYFFIHAFFPDIFEYSGSTIIKKLNLEFLKCN